MDTQDLYEQAQDSLNSLKSCIRKLLDESGDGGLKNAEIGRALGIYFGMVDMNGHPHQGHLSRILLGVMKVEGVVKQDSESKRWTLR